MITDTNALSAIFDEQPGIHAALERAVAALIPVIVLGEYGFGIAQSARRTHYQKWLRESISAFRILDITRETAENYAALARGIKTCANSHSLE